MTQDERNKLRAEELIQLMRMENNAAEYEVHCGDGWRYDHAQAIREYATELDALRTPPVPPTQEEQR